MPKIKHGLTKHPLFTVRNGMLKRCYTPSNGAYHKYGARGVKVCPEWKEDFKVFYNWATANGYQKGLILDRKENSRGYEPDNCRFTDITTSNRNRNRTIPRKGWEWLKI